jgi:hypothetical protein
MQTIVKDFVKGSPLYPLISRLRAGNQIRDWKKKGCPIPPPAVYKHMLVAKCARQFGIKTLIETGTLFGEMVEASNKVFQSIYSIELDETLFKKAAKRFNNIEHIKIIQGDSGFVLPVLLDTIDAPCLFWLDGHYSGAGTGRGEEDTPVSKELQAVLTHQYRDHVVLIDDARLFTGVDGYPTLEALGNMVATQRPEWLVETQHDIIRISPSPIVRR